MRKSLLALGVIILAVIVAGLVVVWVFHDKDSGPVMDEAMAAGKKPSDFPAAANDFFHDMDGRSRDAIPGSSGRRATMRSGTTWRTTASARSIW
jgi:hypothetical protein